MKIDWLWDRNLQRARVKRILKTPTHKNFILLSSLLLERNNNPQTVFKKYIEPLIFCENWPMIKKRMRKDRWSEPRIIFWQAIFDKLSERYRKAGLLSKRKNIVAKDPFCAKVGRIINRTRKNKRLSQKELAKKMGVSQQLISRIEKGSENVSILTLKKIADALGNFIISFDSDTE